MSPSIARVFSACWLAALVLGAGLLRADFDLSLAATGSPTAQGPLVLTNRQAQYQWNNDFFEVVALGFDTSSTVTQPAICYSPLGLDSGNARQYRWQVPQGSIDLKPAWAPDSSTIDTTGPRWGGGPVTLALAGPVPYPCFPHVVLRENPSWGPSFPDTTLYAPPAAAADINAAGALAGQADYYSPTAWFARDDAPLLVNPAEQHPTQLWIGMPDMPPGTLVLDALAPADAYPSYAMRVTASVGYRFGPASPSGGGRAYTHNLGSAPGGVMWALAAAWVQEFFGYDMRVALAIGSQECGAGLFYDGSAGFPAWQWAGDSCADSTVLGDSYQMGVPDDQQSIMAFPDYWPHAQSYLDAPSPAGLAGQVVNSTVALGADLSARYYGYFAVARSLRLGEFAAAASDPYALFRVCAYAYNMGPNDPNVWALVCGGAVRASAEASPNLSNTHGIVGNSAYGPHVVDLARRIGREPQVWDAGFSWGDVQDFMADLRAEQYANNAPSAAQWAALLAELQAAFVAMQGHAPTVGLAADQISFRYNWLTLLRIMKKYLPSPRLYPAKGAVNNQQILQPYECFGVNAQETSPLCQTNNLAPEVYWVSPSYGGSGPASPFAAIANVCRDGGLTLTAEVLDDGVGGAPLTLRYALSPGDPSAAAGASQFQDGTRTGGSAAYPVAQDWGSVPAQGSSSAPAGGLRFSTWVDVGALSGLRRIYLEADDHNGYKTLSWVDLSLTACGTATPTPMVTPTPTATLTPLFTLMPTSTSTPAVSPTLSVTPTLTPTLMVTLTPTLTPTLTVTLTLTPTVTLTPTPTPTLTLTPTLSPGVAISATASPTPSPTGAEPGSVVIDQAFAVPNPNPDRITFHLQGSVDDVLARVYTKALVCLGQAHAGPKAAGWAELSLQGRAFFKANGLYYVTLTPARGQASGKRVLLRMVELR